VARIRSVKPEFWVDDQMVELSFVARLLFIGLWNFVDDDGLIEYKPKRIKMQVFPSDKVSIEKELDSLISSGRLQVIESDQGPLLRVINWDRHQVINHKTNTRFTGILGANSGSTPGDSGSTPVVLPDHSRLNGREGKGREGTTGKLPETRLPSDWSPTAAHVELSKANRIDLMAEADSFRLHAETHDRHAARWNAAFTSWLKKAKPGTAKVSTVDWMNR
jgi:hypothetical protein